MTVIVSRTLAHDPRFHRRSARCQALLAAFVTLLLAAAASGQSNREPLWVGSSDTGLPCRGGQGVGPLDYTSGRDRASKLLGLVEEYHFQPEVEALMADNILGNLDYVLRGVPNHHRALFSMMSYQERSEYQRARKHKSVPTIECYLYRARHFAPHDSHVSVLLGILRHRRGQHEIALKHYRTAEDSGNQSPLLYYNMGLLLVDMGELDDAVRAAERAYAADFPLQGLKKKLALLGHPLD